MPELTGTVTGLIKKRDGAVFGLNIDGEEYLYSWPDKRGEPFEENLVAVGLNVRAEYAPFTDKAGKDKQYISVLEVLEGGAEPSGPYDDERTAPHGDPASAMTGRVAQAGWGFEQKDRLMCRESCAKSATTIFAASIQAGIYKTHPDVSAVTAFAGALEKWCLEAVD